MAVGTNPMTTTWKPNSLSIGVAVRTRQGMFSSVSWHLQIRLYEWKKDNAKVRNDKMRAWVQSRADSGNVFYLDFEHLTHAEGAPLPIGSLNWHYQVGPPPSLLHTWLILDYRRCCRWVLGTSALSVCVSAVGKQCCDRAVSMAAVLPGPRPPQGSVWGPAGLVGLARST